MSRQVNSVIRGRQVLDRQSLPIAANERRKPSSGLLPICAWCKKIRDDGGGWNTVVRYAEQYSAATLTHGVCPDCARNLFSKFFEEAENAAHTAPHPPSMGSGLAV